MEKHAGRFCPVPFERIQLHPGYSVPCCPTWIRFRLPEMRADNLMELWNGPEMQAMRRGVLDGSYARCREDVCPHLCAGTLPTLASATRPHLVHALENQLTVLPNTPTNIQFSDDRSCNLSCPSCRDRRYQDNDDQRVAERKRWISSMLVAAQDCDVVFMTGSGDPFASRSYREFLMEHRGSQRIELMTNGLMLTPKTWRAISHLSIIRIRISIDAASSETYARVRRGGDWDLLMRNLESLAPELAARGILLEFLYVVQRLNYHEMGPVIDIVERFGGTMLFTKIQDWGSYGAAFGDQQPWRQDHPERALLLEALRDPRLRRPACNVGNLRAEMDEALAAAAAD